MIDVLAAVRRALADRYDVERELGGGGMSRVFVIQDRQFRRREVLKLLPPEQAGALSYARFQREIALAARLQHPHIVPLLGAGEIDGMPYFTMPFVEGESLRTRLDRDGEFPIAEAVRLLREVASALAFAHAHGIVHRDIKPENILLSQGIAVVADFGVAKALIEATTVGRGALTTSGVAVGTPAYISPEQATADPELDHRSDLYSLGVVAYELLCGQVPFTARTTQALIAAHVVETPAPLQTRRRAVPPQVAALVMRCLEKRAADRPQQAADIVRELDQPAGSVDAASEGARATPAHTAGAWSGRRWLAATAVAAVLALAAWASTWPTDGPVSTASSSKLLIAPFENLTGDPRFAAVGRIASTQLANMVAQVDPSAVVPLENVSRAMDDSVQRKGEGLQRVAQVTGAGLLLTGNVVLRGDSLQVQGVLTDATTGASLVAFDPMSGPATDPLVAIDALGDRLLSALRSRRELRGLPQGFRPPSFTAQQSFAEGFRKFAQSDDQRGARADFVRATQEDSTYVQAFLLIARLDMNRGAFASADSIYDIIARIPGRRTRADQWNIALARAQMAGQLVEKLRAADSLASVDSSSVALMFVAGTAVELLQPRHALRASEARRPLLKLLGTPATRTWAVTMGDSYHLLGEHGKELAHWREVTSLVPDPAFSLFGRLRASAGLGKAAEPLAIADTLVGLRGAAIIQVLLDGVQELRAHGDSSSAVRLLDRIAAMEQVETASPNGPARLGLVEVIISLIRGRPDSAVTLLERRAKSGRVPPVYAGMLGIAEARRGNVARARRLADSLAASNEPWQFGATTYYSATILAALGEREQAMERLRKAVEQGRPMARWHFGWELEPMRSYQPFREFITPRG